MEAFKKDMLGIIGNAVNGTKYAVSEDFDWKKAYDVSKKHQIFSPVYYGALADPSFMKSEVFSAFTEANVSCVGISERQIYIASELKKIFIENGISFLPIKGIVLKKLYAYPEMRTMSDIDVLIKPEEYDKIREALMAAGYFEGIESDHELHWKKDDVFIELHKRLIPSYNEDYYDYYGDGWRVAKPVGGGEYCMSDEDFFIYIFTHFAKHYRDSGAGIKYVTDFYLYLKKHENLDFGYINGELDKLGLSVFYKNVERMMRVWFDGAEPDEITERLTDKIFESGVYGDAANVPLAEGLKISKSHKNVKGHKFFTMLFPSFTSMKMIYPVLKKAPVLLPVMYVARWFSALFNPKKIKKSVNNLKNYDDESVQKYREELNFVGLDYNFNDKTEAEAK